MAKKTSKPKATPKAQPKKKGRPKKEKIGEDFQDKKINPDEKYFIVADTIPTENQLSDSEPEIEEKSELENALSETEHTEQQSAEYSNNKLREKYPQLTDEDLIGTSEDVAARVSAKLGVAYSDIINLIS